MVELRKLLDFFDFFIAKKLENWDEIEIAIRELANDRCFMQNAIWKFGEKTGIIDKGTGGTKPFSVFY